MNKCIGGQKKSKERIEKRERGQDQLSGKKELWKLLFVLHHDESVRSSVIREQKKTREDLFKVDERSESGPVVLRCVFSLNLFIKRQASLIARVKVTVTPSSALACVRPAVTAVPIVGRRGG